MKNNNYSRFMQIRTNIYLKVYYIYLLSLKTILYFFTAIKVCLDKTSLLECAKTYIKMLKFIINNFSV